MLEAAFIVSLLLPPAVIVLSAAALAIGSISRRSESVAHLREHHV
jgi:hypothetical protein